MLYILLKPFIKVSTIANFFSYISVRTFGALFFSFAIWMWRGEYFIALLKRFQKNGCKIRDLGQSGKGKKESTPTAGGIFIISSVMLSSLIWRNFQNIYIILLLVTLVVHGSIGFVDDFLKIKQQSYDGVPPWGKLFVQGVFSIIVYFTLISNLDYGFVTSINVPFLKNTVLPLGILYPVFIFCVISGSSNAVNLSDGLDGLAVGPIMIVTACMGLLCYLSGHVLFAKYLYVPYIQGAGEVVVFCGALFGSCMGFLWYNAHPAMVFMGDTGALAIGAALGLISLIVKQEIIFAVISFVFVWEALSVIIQVLYYKKSKKRAFLMAPFHHHLEKKGWSETQIVIRSWIASFLFALIGLACIKLR